MNFELKSSHSDNTENMTNGAVKKDLPKVDINKRRELFEKESKSPEKNNRSSGDFSQAPLMSIKERLSHLEKQKEEGNIAVQTKRLSGDVASIKDRLKNLEKETSQSNSTPRVEIPLSGSIKDRLSSLHSSVSTTATLAAHHATNEDPSAAAANAAKGAVVVGVAKKPWTVASDVDQVIEVETLKIEIEQLKLNEAAPESLMTMDSIQDAVQDYVTIVQDVKMTVSQTQAIREKEEYREITDEDLFGGTDIDIDGDADVEIDNLQQDMSVSSTTETVSNSIIINGPRGAGSLDNVNEGSLEMPSTEGGSCGNGGDEVKEVTNTNSLMESLTALDNLLKRSTSNNNLDQQPVCDNYRVVVNSSEECVKRSLNNQSNINNNNHSLNPKSSGCPLPKSISENSIAKLRNLATENAPLRSSQSEFFDAKSGDRHCILLIDNSRS